MRKAKDREGVIDTLGGHDEHKMRQSLNAFLADEDPLNRKLTKLPGAEFKSDLPADPITRLFFQAKGSHALYQGTYDSPLDQDPDRVQLQDRDLTAGREHYKSEPIITPVADMCYRIAEGCERRKRFVILPSTVETKGAASVMLDHGFIAGFRDFHNDRAFAVELKYFQNKPVIEMIEPASRDKKVEFEWTPQACRSMCKAYGIENHIRIYILRTWDGRVIDMLQARREGIGGRAMLMVQ